MRLKLLLHSNAPWSPSGYGQQIALFAPRLAEQADVAISAFHGLANAPLSVAGLTIYPGSGAGWGNDVVHANAERHFGSLRGGLVLSLVDVFVLDPAVWSELNAACWVPVDHDPAPPAVLQFFAATGAVPIAMSRFGRERLAPFDPLYVPHGVASDVFAPQPRAAARAASGIPRDAFAVGVVAVNKGVPSRKSLAEMIEAFAIFRARHDDALLYLHTELYGTHAGTHLPSLLDELGVAERAVRVVDQGRYLLHPFTPEEMAGIYSSLDVLVNASMGEGFGLPVLEANACGVPAIVTDFTAMSEVCGAGWKVGYERFWSDQSSWQARPHVEEIVESLEECYALDDAARAELSARAREHALAYDADRVLVEHWLPALEQVALRLPGLVYAGGRGGARGG
jgi:glycosyltransferase involved in cell wall biosynthesis